jgi:Skp family chaperone for outer membrane proteins
MKKTTIVLSILVMFGFALFGEVKIGVVHPMYVLQNSVKGKKIIADLEVLGKKKQQAMEAIQNEIRSLTADLQKPLNASTKEEKTLLLQRKQTKFKRVFQDSQAEVKREQGKKIGEFRKQILPLIHNYCKDNGFTIVFDGMATGIAYMQETVDISKAIVKLVDSKIK